MPLAKAIALARSKDLDLVEVAPNAKPPVCRLVDYGKFRYEQNKKEKESRKHQHANRVKEIQLRPSIDPHDFQTKINHAIDFLCEENKVKVTLKFRGRENAHKEFGFEVVKKLVEQLEPYGTPDAPPKMVGRGINLMISPLPRAKRAANPNEKSGGESQANGSQGSVGAEDLGEDEYSEEEEFQNNPFSGIKVDSSET
jgi:translation initiation factor IF-3